MEKYMGNDIAEKGNISKNIEEFVSENADLLKRVKKFRKRNNKKLHIIIEKERDLYKYISNVKVLIITANEIEKTSLFTYVYKHNYTPFVQIGKGNNVYTIFAFGSMMFKIIK